MEHLKAYPAELEIGSSMESFHKFLESQRSLFHSQIGHLQNVVATQCKLTGVNPLSQEMAAGALFVKIGKRPRDLLNPKAVNYMHSVFSIKDAVTKKEIRDISARFGMTATQVKEYFTNQRSRVRRLIRLSREKTLRNGFSEAIEDEAPLSSIIPVDPDPMCQIAPSKSEESPPCSNQQEVLNDLADSDKNFVDNIFSLMQNEDTFSGQVKLMEWILQIKNPSVLSWFLARGGLMILATWLSQAASEEQTSVLYVVLKVLTFLPLNRALPVHMSAIIQSVNKLRFYGKADVSNRARALLSCWSKMFSKSQPIKRVNGVKPSDSNNEIDLKQRISELMSDELEQHAADKSEDARYGSVDETRRLESPHAIKLLTASADDSNKRLVLGIPTYKERRKVLLVEQPGQKTPGKNQQAVKAVNASSNARPITVDEIQKAKLRAQYMQSKHDKVGLPSKDSEKSKSNNSSKRPSSLLTNDLLSASEAYLRPKLEAHKKAMLLPQKNAKQIENISDQKLVPHVEKKMDVILKRVRIPWHVPPEIRMDPSWKVCSGDKSKEGDAQRNRISREKESVYRTREDVPSNPKEPWDVELDYDDTLTPEVPVQQLPEMDTGSTSSSVPLACDPTPPAAQPDLELLALLLKNPQLVFALTSSSSSNPDTVKLLDLIKNNPGILTSEASLPSPTPNAGSLLHSPTPAAASRFDVSLPSPTPPVNAAPSGWRQETVKNPFSRQSSSTVLQQQYQASATVTASAVEQQRSSSSSWSHASLNQPANNHQHFQQHKNSQNNDNNSNYNNNMLEQSHPVRSHHLNPRQQGGWAGHSSASESRYHQERSSNGRRAPWRRDEDLTGFTDQSGGRRWLNQDRRGR